MTGDPLDEDDPAPVLAEVAEVSRGAGGEAFTIRRCFFDEPSTIPDKEFDDDAGRSTRTPEAKSEGGVIDSNVVSGVVFEVEGVETLCPFEDGLVELGLFPIPSFLFMLRVAPSLCFNAGFSLNLTFD